MIDRGKRAEEAYHQKLLEVTGGDLSKLMNMPSDVIEQHTRSAWNAAIEAADLEQIQFQVPGMSATVIGEPYSKMSSAEIMAHLAHSLGKKDKKLAVFEVQDYSASAYYRLPSGDVEPKNNALIVHIGA